MFRKCETGKRSKQKVTLIKDSNGKNNQYSSKTFTLYECNKKTQKNKGGQEMSCDFYTYKGGTLFGDFYCMKKEDTINMDTYNRYCKNYNYKECPIYKSGNSSGCYLTSACIFAKGLKDDCHELTTLRQFRDQWLAKNNKRKKTDQTIL